MAIFTPSWILPDAAWQAVVEHLPLDDLIAARLVCKAWRKDLGAFVVHVTAIPTQLSAARHSTACHFGAADEVQADAVDEVPGHATDEADESLLAESLGPRLLASSTDCTGHQRRCSDGTIRNNLCAFVSVLSQGFPHCRKLTLDVCSDSEHRVIDKVMSAIHDHSSSIQCNYDTLPLADCAEGGGHSRLSVCFDAMQRSYHCLARQEYPCRAPAAGSGLFTMLSRLPQAVSPSALAMLHRLQLDVFPEQPCSWLALQQLPGLRELVLPGFKPALPHHHLTALARVTQLTAATLSIQGSFTSWRANCEAFRSLSSLTGLSSLTLHAFHCPGHQLTAALAAMKDMQQLRLSGRIVLEPLAALHQLTKMQVLELTQDVECSALCDLARHLTAVTQLAVGRVNLPPIAAAQPAAAAGTNAQAPTAAEDNGAVAAPAAAEAAAVVVAADAGAGGAAVAAAAAEGGGNEVMLEDVGAIVDGLIGNLQEGNVPVHLQRIIERFESIIQLDLTRSSASSPWGWPVLGISLLEQLDRSGNGSTATAARRASSSSSSGTSSSSSGTSSNSTKNSSTRSSCTRSINHTHKQAGGINSLELALLRTSDVVQLDELPEQIRCCRHLGLRLRDQLLAFASVCPVRLAQGQLVTLASTFASLQSLSLCGKVAVDGTTLCQLAQSLGDGEEGAAAASQGIARKRHGLLALSLDCHFVSVSSEQALKAMRSLSNLRVLSLRHRGQGKFPLPSVALPQHLMTLALKKVYLYADQPDLSPAAHALSSNDKCASTVSAVPVDRAATPDEAGIHCHVIVSPGFRKAAARGTLSASPSGDLAALVGASAQEQQAGSSTSAAPGTWGQQQTVLPQLASLLLKNCLVTTEATHQLLGSSQLTKLSITGDNSSHAEVAEGWSSWLEVIKQMQRLQVLDLTVPESLDCSLSADLLAALVALPRLAHLHLTTSHKPLQLLGLTSLKGLRTVSLHYSGPPALPSQLLSELQAGLGQYCKVRLWEMLVLQHVSSFGGGSTTAEAAAGTDGEQGRARRRVVKRLVGVIGHFAAAVGGYCFGWRATHMLLGHVEKRRLKRHAPRHCSLQP